MNIFALIQTLNKLSHLTVKIRGTLLVKIDDKFTRIIKENEYIAKALHFFWGKLCVRS